MNSAHPTRASVQAHCARKLLTGAAVLLAVSGSTGRLQAQHVAAEWTSQTTGTLAGTGFSVIGFDPRWGLSTQNLVGAAFAAGELGSVTMAGYATRDTWTVNFAAPVSGLRLYMRSWRGRFVSGSGNPSSTYAFSSVFSVLSGLSDITTDGTSFTLPGDRFFNGILEFNGVISSLTVTSTSDRLRTASEQALTFAAPRAIGPGPTPVPVPEPASVGLLVLALLPIAVASARRRVAS